jgi:hypothetical protein
MPFRSHRADWADRTDRTEFPDVQQWQLGSSEHHSGIGAGAQTPIATEQLVQQVVPVAMTFGHFDCTSIKPTGSNSVTFNLRQSTASGGNFGAATTIATCSVTSGNVSGSTTGSVSVVAGDVYDVEVITPTGVVGGVSAALAP